MRTDQRILDVQRDLLMSREATATEEELIQ